MIFFFVDFDVINMSSQQYELLILTSTVICFYTLLLLHHFYKVATIWFLKKEGWHLKELYKKIFDLKFVQKKSFPILLKKIVCLCHLNSTNNN